MTTTKVSSTGDSLKNLQDKTDWSKVYKKPQSVVDKEAVSDKENPILKGARSKRLKDSK